MYQNCVRLWNAEYDTVIFLVYWGAKQGCHKNGVVTRGMCEMQVGQRSAPSRYVHVWGSWGRSSRCVWAEDVPTAGAQSQQRRLHEAWQVRIGSTAVSGVQVPKRQKVMRTHEES